MRINKRAVLTLLCSAFIAAGCQDMDLVSNQSAPQAKDILSDPMTLEMVVAGSWATIWNYTQNNSSTYWGSGIYGDETSSGDANRVHYGGLEPREPYPNDYSLSSRFLAQNPWYAVYEGIDDTNQALRLIEQEGMRIVKQETELGDTTAEDKTDRARAFAYFVQGVLFTYYALTYDQATVALPTTDRSKADWWHHKPYTEVAQAAYQQLGKAIELAETIEPFETPPEWTSGAPIDNELMIKLANSYIARTMVYLARTPEERRDVSEGGIVDWRKVIEHLDKGITEDYAPIMSPSGRQSNYLRYLQYDGYNRASPRLFGPADHSGAYAEWLDTPLEERNRFTILTHDRRITGVDSLGNPAPTEWGKYFRYVATDPSSWLGYQRQAYVFWRYPNSPASQGGEWRNGPRVMLSVDEMNLLRAEAHYRLGEFQEAADLINITRVANGELPPVTAAGIAEPMPDCTPRSFDGKECGTLLDALHHERMIELAGTEIWRHWWDRRGFGTLNAGVPTQLPIPTRELQALGLPFYTFGGDQPSSADGIMKVR